MGLKQNAINHATHMINTSSLSDVEKQKLHKQVSGMSMYEVSSFISNFQLILKRMHQAKNKEKQKEDKTSAPDDTSTQTKKKEESTQHDTEKNPLQREYLTYNYSGEIHYAWINRQTILKHENMETANKEQAERKFISQHKDIEKILGSELVTTYNEIINDDLRDLINVNPPTGKIYRGLIQLAEEKVESKENMASDPSPVTNLTVTVKNNRLHLRWKTLTITDTKKETIPVPIYNIFYKRHALPKFTQKWQVDVLKQDGTTTPYFETIHEIPALIRGYTADFVVAYPTQSKNNTNSNVVTLVIPLNATSPAKEEKPKETAQPDAKDTREKSNLPPTSSNIDAVSDLSVAYVPNNLINIEFTVPIFMYDGKRYPLEEYILQYRAKGSNKWDRENYLEHQYVNRNNHTHESFGLSSELFDRPGTYEIRLQSRGINPKSGSGYIHSEWSNVFTLLNGEAFPLITVPSNVIPPPQDEYVTGLYSKYFEVAVTVGKPQEDWLLLAAIDTKKVDLNSIQIKFIRTYHRMGKEVIALLAVGIKK